MFSLPGNSIKKRELLIVSLIFINTAALRFILIEQKNLWFDEVFSWHLSQKPLKEIFIGTSGDIHPPLFYILLKYWTVLFTDTMFSMRSISVICSLASFIALYKICLQLRLREIIIYTCLILFCLNPLNVYYSQEVRMLGLNLFFCLSATYWFISLAIEFKGKYAFLYILFCILALYTHYFSGLIIISHFIYFLIYKKDSFKQLMLCFFIIALSYLPWIPVLTAQISKGQSWRVPQTSADTFFGIFEYIREMFFSVYIHYEPVSILYASYILTAIIIFLIIFSIDKALKSKDAFRLNAVIVLISILIGAIVFWRTNILLSRYLSILVPYFMILLSFSAFSYKKIIASIVTLALFSSSLLGLIIYYENDFKNNDYRDVVQYVSDNISQEDLLTVEPHYMGWGVDYIRNHNKVSIPAPVNLGWNYAELTDSLKIKENISSIWIILDYSSLDTMEYNKLPELMSDEGYTLKQKKEFFIIPNKVSVQHFTR